MPTRENSDKPPDAAAPGSPEEVLREFVYRPPWAAILAMGAVAPALVMGTVLLALGGRLGHVVSVWEKAAVLVLAMLLLPSAVYSARMGWLMLRRRLEGAQRVILTRDSLRVPANPGSREEVSIPYGKIQHLRLDEAVSTKRLCIVRHKQRIVLLAGVLPDPESLAEVARFLSERTGLPVELVRWFPRQFSLRAAFILMTVVAVLLSVWVCLKKLLRWEVSPQVVVFLAVNCCVLVLTSCVLRTKSRRLLVFAAGFFLGLLAEWAALCLWLMMDSSRLAPNATVPDNAYPLSALAGRLLSGVRMIDGLSSVEAGLISIVAGVVFSGLIGGLLALGIRRVVRCRSSHQNGT